MVEFVAEPFRPTIDLTEFDRVSLLKTYYVEQMLVGQIELKPDGTIR